MSGGVLDISRRVLLFELVRSLEGLFGEVAIDRQGLVQKILVRNLLPLYNNTIRIKFNQLTLC